MSGPHFVRPFQSSVCRTAAAAESIVLGSSCVMPAAMPYVIFPPAAADPDRVVADAMAAVAQATATAAIAMSLRTCPPSSLSALDPRPAEGWRDPIPHARPAQALIHGVRRSPVSG